MLLRDRKPVKELMQSISWQIAKDLGLHPKSLKAQQKAREVIREMFAARNKERESVAHDTNELLRQANGN